MNDNVFGYDEITIHTTYHSYVRETVDPLNEERYLLFATYTVNNFAVDNNGHWHLLISQ
jgi:hypothetical protein